MKKIAIVGCGAMGSVFAALFREAGHDVYAVDTWFDHVEAISAYGLKIEGASGDRVVRGIQATTSSADPGPCDLVVIATKASGVGPAAETLAPLLRPDTPVVTIQNGLGAAERIARHMDTSNVLIGVAEAFGASIKAPGRVHHNSMKMIRLGELGGGTTNRLHALVELWRNAGFNAAAYDDVDQLVWEKFICNVAFSAPCTVFDRTIGEAMADPDIWSVCAGCAIEAYRTARALGVAVSFDDPVSHVREFGSRMPNARPSMLLDHIAGRRSEIDAINGMVPVMARRVGGEAPFNEVVSAIVRVREASFP